MLVHDKRRLIDALDLTADRTADDLGLTAAEHERLMTLRDWATTFLFRPNPDLGRAGPVCPYARPAMENGLFLLGEIDLPFDRLDDLADEVRSYKEWFVSMQTVLSPERHGCILLSLPQCDAGSTERIDALQLQLKDEFIGEQLMVGQFHPHHAESGLWNPDFRPLAAPIPAIAIRRMVASDLPFLVSRTAWVEQYLQLFAPGVPRHTARFLADRVVGDGAPR